MRSLQPLRAIVEGLVDVVAPARCMGCLREDTWLCTACRSRASAYPLSCIVCGEAEARGSTCSSCRAHTQLTGVVSVGGYHNRLLQRGVGWLKYRSVTAVAPVLASLLLPRLLVIAPWQELQQHAVLVPIPLHAKRQRERGFNQSQEIARAITATLNIPTAMLLTRTRSTWTQSKLPKEMRQQNMQRSFAIADQLPIDRSLVILIDDVTTTGSTLSAAAQTLHHAGVPLIWGATIARG